MKESIFLLITLVFICCQIDKSKKSNGYILKKENKIIKNDFYTIIYTQRDSLENKLKPSKTLPADRSILYYLDNFQLKHYIAKDLVKSDTLRIEVERDSILIDLTYYQLESISYLLKKGDTMRISYQNAFPKVKILNRKTFKRDFSCDSLLKKVLNDTIPAIDYLMNFSEKIKSYEQFYKRQKDKMEREQKILDSLFTIKEISENYYKIRKEKSKFDYLNLHLFFSSTKKNKNSISIEKEDLNREELLDYSFYYKFLVQYAYNFLNKNKGSYSKLGFTYNSKNIFNKLVKDSTISSKLIKGLLLTHSLKNIRKDYSEKEFNEYYNLYLEIVKDTAMINRFKRENLLNYDNYRGIRDSTYFLNSQKKVFNLKEIIEKNKGKLIYIDFWASWCIPCRKLMDNSKILSNKYREDVVFIYISIDKNRTDWFNAYKEEKIDSYINNLLAINYPNSIFYKNLKLSSIPRYMLFDRKGRLVHKNAPSPDTKEIEILFKKYLINKQN